MDKTTVVRAAMRNAYNACPERLGDIIRHARRAGGRPTAGFRVTSASESACWLSSFVAGSWFSELATVYFTFADAKLAKDEGLLT